MFKYKLNHDIDEQTCLSYYLVLTHRFSSYFTESGLYTKSYSIGQTRWNGLKIGECGLNKMINKFVHQYCDLISI